MYSSGTCDLYTLLVEAVIRRKIEDVLKYSEVRFIRYEGLLGVAECVKRLCSKKTGWEFLACVTENFDIFVKEIGRRAGWVDYRVIDAFKEMMRSYGCSDIAAWYERVDKVWKATPTTPLRPTV